MASNNIYNNTITHFHFHTIFISRSYYTITNYINHNKRMLDEVSANDFLPKKYVY